MHDRAERLEVLLTAEMFVALSKESPRRSLASGFGQGIMELTTDGSFDALTNATATLGALIPMQLMVRRALQERLFGRRDQSCVKGIRLLVEHSSYPLVIGIPEVVLLP